MYGYKSWPELISAVKQWSDFGELGFDVESFPQTTTTFSLAPEAEDSWTRSVRRTTTWPSAGSTISWSMTTEPPLAC